MTKKDLLSLLLFATWSLKPHITLCNGKLNVCSMNRSSQGKQEK